MSQIICVILTWNTVSSQPTVLAISLLGIEQCWHMLPVALQMMKPQDSMLDLPPVRQGFLIFQSSSPKVLPECEVFSAFT